MIFDIVSELDEILLLLLLLILVLVYDQFHFSFEVSIELHICKTCPLLPNMLI